MRVRGRRAVNHPHLSRCRVGQVDHGRLAILFAFALIHAKDLACDAIVLAPGLDPDRRALAGVVVAVGLQCLGVRRDIERNRAVVRVVVQVVSAGHAIVVKAVVLCRALLLGVVLRRQGRVVAVTAWSPVVRRVFLLRRLPIGILASSQEAWRVVRTSVDYLLDLGTLPQHYLPDQHSPPHLYLTHK